MTYSIIQATDKNGFPAWYAEVYNNDLTKRLYTTFAYSTPERAELEAKQRIESSQNHGD